MAACVPITQEKIRGEVWMGTTILARTPFVKSFNVSASRSQASNTFSVTFEMIAGLSFPIGEKLVIKAGTKGNVKTIFTGFIEGTTVQPSFGKPSYFSVTLSGRGVLSLLEDKKFSRRLKADGQGLFCTITGGALNRPKSYYNLDKPVTSGNQTTLSRSPNPASRGTGENSGYVVHNDARSGGGATGGKVSDLAGQPTGSDASTSDGLTTHTHESLEQGGPAFAVYSTD